MCNKKTLKIQDPMTTKLATFGGGCFWCTEACFKRVKGVLSVQNGYAGGTDPTPSYKKICSGQSDHAEVIQVKYDESQATYDKLLAAFFLSHDPTQLNKQGNDVGTQYRSIILYHDEDQQTKAENFIKNLNQSKYNGKVVTQVQQYTEFFPAEKYHDDYFTLNPNEGYCKYVIQSKVEKFAKEFQN